MRSSIIPAFFLLSLLSHADRFSGPSHTPVHSYAYDYTCVMLYPGGAMREDDGVVINFPTEVKPLDVGFVNDGDLGSLDCSMQIRNDALAFDCQFMPRYTLKINIQSNLSGEMVVTGPSKNEKYDLLCRDNRR